MSENIDHAAEARKHIDWAHAQQGNDGEFDYSVRDNALIAQAEATLALVEQQRIANLIVLSNSAIGELISAGHRGLTEREPHPEYEGVMVDVMRPEIRKGLGL